MRKVAEARIDVHLTVGIKAGGVEPDATLEIPVHADPRRARVPPVTVDVLERVAVAGTLHESAGLVRHRIVRRIGERPEGISGRGDARRVDVVLGTRRAVLQVIAPAVLRHPRAFDVRMDGRIAMIPTKSFPPMEL